MIDVFDWLVKLEEGSKTENLQAQRCRARLDHLESADVENLSEWNNVRLNRILVDYMLRMSYYDTAAKMAESQNIQVVELTGLGLASIMLLCGSLCYGFSVIYVFVTNAKHIN